MSKHTPGPWKYVAGKLNCPRNEFNHGSIVSKDNWIICECTEIDHEKGIDVANARLIAAAPEMYELLEKMLAYKEHILSDTYKEIELLLNKIDSK